MPTKLETVTGEVLMGMDLPPTRMIVDRLLPQGLHILAGAPKIGKSWLTMQLALQVAKGEPIWGLPTEKGTVLYLCLEDSLGRIQKRMLDLTDSASPNIHFTTMAETITGGLDKQISTFIAEFPDTNFIAIDTLQRIRNISGDMNAYANDYRDINLLKQISDKHGICILLVHHLRKQSDSDPLNMISGTTGLTGAVDSLYVLQKESRSSRSAKLIVTGRDIEDMEYILEFDRDTHFWNFVADNSDGHFSSAADKTIAAVIEFMKSEEIFIGTASELAEKMNADVSPSVLTKKILQNKAELFVTGITIARSRTGSKRELTLMYEPPADDGNDSNDGKTDSGPVPHLPSQPSLPSQTESGGGSFE